MRTLKCWIIAMIMLLPMVAFAENGTDVQNWRLDAPRDRVVPANLRVDDRLSISGSGQMSPEGLRWLYGRLKDRAVYVVDLRQEPHGFADGVPVSWHTRGNAANAGLSAGEVERREMSLLMSGVGRSMTAYPMGRMDIESGMAAVSFTPSHVSTERMEAELAGLRYVRISAVDMRWPDPEAVDEFMDFYRELSGSRWVHFHCQAGRGRTTTFMALYEILACPNETVEQVAAHQKEIGGIDLAAAGRLEQLRLFHRFADETRPGGFVMRWSDWLRANGM